MSEEEMLDRIVEIFENSPSPLPEELLSEWKNLNDGIRALYDKPRYSFTFWHKGHIVELRGSQIELGKMSEEQYADMFEVFGCRMTPEEYNKKWNDG